MPANKTKAAAKRQEIDPVFMDYKLTEEVLEMSGIQSAYQKNIELYMKKYGEVLLRGLTPEEILRGLDPETREKLKQLIKNQDEKQS